MIILYYGIEAEELGSPNSQPIDFPYQITNITVKDIKKITLANCIKIWNLIWGAINWNWYFVDSNFRI